MKNIIESKVYYADTDAYGVVWHGSYLKWLEQGRVEWCEQAGHNLCELSDNGIVLPVVNLNVKYKTSARLNDKIIVETEIEKFNGLSVTFKQKILSKDTGKTFIKASVEVVAIDNDGKLYRRMPEILANVFKTELLKDG
ncbi:acyl-CoA thioesterase [bacterium]|nr:acyl-CoA thioesterase [bacterium]